MDATLLAEQLLSRFMEKSLNRHLQHLMEIRIRLRNIVDGISIIILLLLYLVMFLS